MKITLTNEEVVKIVSALRYMQDGETFHEQRKLDSLIDKIKKQTVKTKQQEVDPNAIPPEEPKINARKSKAKMIINPNS